MGFFSKLKSVFTKQVDDTSEKGEVNKTDTAKVIRNTVFVAIAAGISYLITNVDPDSLGPYAPLITVGGAAILDFINKFVKGK